jgi:phosphoribosyl 1,2-cyclic phosphodiesterase
MKLTFLGTRGYIEAKSRFHRMHTSLLVTYRRTRVMIDCGETWRDKTDALAPRAIVLTHAHPDHAGGLVSGLTYPVYATDQTWDLLKDLDLPNRHTVKPRKPFDIGGIRFEAFEVEHSIRCPAVCYRITAGHAIVLYAPDVVYIPNRQQALAGVQVYIGDGATLRRPMVRKRGRRLIGHAPVQTQLTWCKKEGVPRAVISHCGTAIVTAGERKARAQLETLATEKGVEVTLAHDGMELVLRGPRAALQA